jgi:hypothetical protein
MEKKLFVVTIETEVVVLAEDESQAEEEAQRHVRGEIDEWDFRAAPMSFMPAGWDEDCFPFQQNDQPDRTVGEWIDLGAAPKYVELRNKLKKGTKGL